MIRHVKSVNKDYNIVMVFLYLSEKCSFDKNSQNIYEVNINININNILNDEICKNTIKEKDILYRTNIKENIIKESDINNDSSVNMCVLGDNFIHLVLCYNLFNIFYLLNRLNDLINKAIIGNNRAFENIISNDKDTLSN